MKTSLDLELQAKISEKIGREKAREVMSLIVEYGIDVVTKLGSVGVHLPNLEIRSLTPKGEYGTDVNYPARRHLFECKINGESFGNMLRKIELDPFDYTDGEIFEAKITIIPIVTKEEDNDEGRRSS